MITAALATATSTAQRLTDLSALGWFFMFFVTWACLASVVTLDVLGLAFALGITLGGFRWFPSSLLRSGGSS